VVGEWIENSYGICYTRSARLWSSFSNAWGKLKVMPSKLNAAEQRDLVAGYEKLLNHLGDDEAEVFADAVHPTHDVRPAGCWALKRLEYGG
jgi:hypothetical protein